MQYGAMNFPIKPVGEELEEIAALGFDYLELTMDPPQAHYTTIRQQMRSILSALNSHGMKVISHLPTFVSTADLTESIREASLQEMFHSLEVAAELGSLKVVVHPGHIGGLGAYVMETAQAYGDESLTAIINRAQNLGLCVCLENMFPRCRSYFKPDDFIQILQRFPDLKLTLDTGHASIGDPSGRRASRPSDETGRRAGPDPQPVARDGAESRRRGVAGAASPSQPSHGGSPRAGVEDTPAADRRRLQTTGRGLLR